MILADTSIWIDHFRSASPGLDEMIGSGRIVMHPFIVTEVALGSLSRRHLKLSLMQRLLQLRVASEDEVREMIEARMLYSRGIGFVDVHLIASCLLTSGTRLWTRDARLRSAAESSGITVLQ